MIKTALRISAFFAFGLAMGATGIGCGEADRTFDCQQVCNRYKECVDKDYDVGACRSRCGDNADDSASFEAKADACEDCLDNKSCTGAVFTCATECAGIVP